MRTTAIQTSAVCEGSYVTTTYTRTDLGIQTALVAPRRDGRWEARLYYGPEPDEHLSETADRKASAHQLAMEHSLNF